MAHLLTISVPNDVYAWLQREAEEQGAPVEAVVESLVTLRAFGAGPHPHDPAADPHHYTTDDFLRHLGATEEEIRRAKDEAAKEEPEYEEVEDEVGSSANS